MNSPDFIDFAISYDKISSEKWFLPTDIAPKIELDATKSKESLEKWVNLDIEHDFKSWILSGTFFNDLTTKTHREAVSLYGYTNIAEPSNIGQTSWDSVCVLAEPTFFEQFDKLEKYFGNSQFEDLGTFKAGTKSTYFSPRDLSWMTWVEEENSHFEFNYSSINLFNTITDITEDTVSRGEKRFVLPSKLIRSESKITTFENGKSFNDDGKLIVWTHKAGEFSGYENKQELLFIDKQVFETMLSRLNLKPFWVFIQIKNTTLKFRETRSNPFSQNCKKWIVWQEGTEFKSYKYHDGYYSNVKSPPQ